MCIHLFIIPIFHKIVIQRNFKKQSYISRYLYWLLELHITFIFIDLGLHSRRSWIYVIYSRYVWIAPIYHLLYRDVLNVNYFKMSKNVWKICKWCKLRIFILLKMGLVCWVFESKVIFGHIFDKVIFTQVHENLKHIMFVCFPNLTFDC